MSKKSKARRDEKKRNEAERQRHRDSALRLGGSGKATGERLSVEVPYAKLGPPGIPQLMHAIAGPGPGLEGSFERNQGLIHDETEREFHVLVHLAKEPGSFASESIDLAAPPERGASLVKSPPGTTLQFETSFGRVDTVANNTNEVAALRFRCKAMGWRDVLRKYSDMVVPFVDHLSFSSNVPIFVRFISWEDRANHVVGASYVPPYESAMVAGSHSFELEMRPFFALYREGISSGSVFYQFLCFAKVLEGCFRWLMDKLRKEAKALGLPPPRLDIRVDDDESILGEGRLWIGKGVEQTFNDYLQPKFRNALAHFAADDQDPVVTSDYFASGAIADNLFLMRHCARKAMEASIQSLQAIKRMRGAHPAPPMSSDPFIGRTKQG